MEGAPPMFARFFDNGAVIVNSRKLTHAHGQSHGVDGVCESSVSGRA